MIRVKDFFPKYPNIDNTPFDVLNPYSDFYNSITQKKEFYDNKLKISEQVPIEKGIKMNHQEIVARYMNAYDELLLLHEMGTGKTCTAVGVCEEIKKRDKSINGVIVLADGENLIENFKNEIVHQCTSVYVPENYEKLTDNERVRRINKNLSVFYSFDTFQKFAKYLAKLRDEDIINQYSNKVIVIDEVHNLRPQEERKQESLEEYKQYHRFLHLIKNRKILLLSGTPIKDSPDEIADVLNLILPLDSQLPTGKEFLKEFMKKKGDNLYEMREDKLQLFQELCKGKLSFVKEMQSLIKKDFQSDNDIPNNNLKFFKVKADYMSSFQSKHYLSAMASDNNGFYSNGREATLFVYPDGSYGSKGFNKYIVGKTIKTIKGKDKKVYDLTDDFKKLLQGNNDEETLKNIRKYSSKYASVISDILNTKGNCFIYSVLAKGSGAILFSLLLNLFGYKKASGNESKPAKRYSLLTTETASSTEVKRIKKRFNSPDNVEGDFIKVIIGTKTVSEGLTFSNVVYESTLTPFWNYSQIAQALARGIRLNSHKYLIQKRGENISVNIRQCVSIAKDGSSLDLLIYKMAEDKDITIRKLIRIMMKISFDCSLNYERNRSLSGSDGSRDCDYQKCEYTCIDSDKTTIDELDYSSYHPIYAEKIKNPLKDRIESLYKEYMSLSNENIVNSLQNEFTKEEIYNALVNMKPNRENTYNDYVSSHTIDSFSKITLMIETLFQTHFHLTFEDIYSFLSEYTRFEILAVLSNIISENRIIRDRYGMVNYLREDQNIYFLSKDMSRKAYFTDSYYSEFPTIYFQEKDVFEKQIIKNIIQNICESKTDSDFTSNIKLLPDNVKELFIEASIQAREQGLDESSIIQERVFSFFRNYIHKTETGYISTLFDPYRCYNLKTGIWSECGEDIYVQLDEKKKEEQQKIRTNNPYGLIGKINPQKDKNKTFCLVDLEAEKGIANTADKRKSLVGKNCFFGWKLNQLVSFILFRLKLTAPKDYLKGFDRQKLKQRLKETKIYDLYQKDWDDEMLRNACYFGGKKSDGGKGTIPQLCPLIRDFLDKEGFVQDDNQCGVQGKTKIDKGTSKEKMFNIVILNLKKDAERIDESRRLEIAKMINDRYGIKKFKLDSSDGNKNIAMILSKNKLVGFLIIEKGIVSHVAIAKGGYDRKGVRELAIKQAIEKTGEVRLHVDKGNKKLIRMYTGLGFTNWKTENNQIVMKLV